MDNTWYILQMQICSRIFFQESLNLPYFFIEDVYMGGFVADRCLVPKKEPPGFSPGRKEVAEVKADFDLLIHYMDHEYKFNVHKVITEGHNKLLAVWTNKQSSPSSDK